MNWRPSEGRECSNECHHLAKGKSGRSFKVSMQLQQQVKAFSSSGLVSSDPLHHGTQPSLALEEYIVIVSITAHFTRTPSLTEFPSQQMTILSPTRAFTCSTPPTNTCHLLDIGIVLNDALLILVNNFLFLKLADIVLVLRR